MVGMVVYPGCSRGGGVYQGVYTQGVYMVVYASQTSLLMPFHRGLHGGLSSIALLRCLY